MNISGGLNGLTVNGQNKPASNFTKEALYWIARRKTQTKKAHADMESPGEEESRRSRGLLPGMKDRE